MDDIAVLALVMKLVHSDVEEYKHWRVVNYKQVIFDL